MIGLSYLFPLLLGQLVRTSIRIITRKSRTILVRREFLRNSTKTRKGSVSLDSY
jgi:hypothetical protein